MSYVQGTHVIVKGEFTDPDSGDFVDPDDVVVTIWAPEGPTTVRAYGDDSGVTKSAVGKYQTIIDTTPYPGTWVYVFEGTGVEAVAKKQNLRIRPRPALVT